MDNWTQEAFDRFWSKMLGIYGKRWAEDHGSKINDVWRDTLKIMTFEKVVATLNVCIESGDAHPITLSQFVSRARAIKLKGASEAFETLPAPNLTQEQIDNNQKRFNEVTANTVKKSGKRLRSVLLPGENYWDYKDALRACGSEAERKECTNARLLANGWTEQDEIRFGTMGHKIGLRVVK